MSPKSPRAARKNTLHLTLGINVPLSPAPSPSPSVHGMRCGEDHFEDVSAEWHLPPQDPHMRGPSETSICLASDVATLPDSEKIEVLKQVLGAASYKVLLETFQFVDPRLRHDPFRVLPTEISLRILSYIREPQSLANASQVSRLWYLLISDDYTWKQLCEAHHYRRLSAAGSLYVPDARTPALVRQNAAQLGNLRQVVFDPHASEYVPPTSYRSHFKQQYLLNSAWESGGRLAARYVLQHTENIIATVLEMCGEYVVVALDNSKILVFGLDGRLLWSLFGHVMGVWALAIEGSTLVSGGCDRDVRVWDLKTGLCTRILKGHGSTVRCLTLMDGIAVSGSRDTTLRVWDTRTGECLHVLEGHSASVRQVVLSKINGEIHVASGSYDCTVNVWRLATGELLHTLQGHFSQIYSLAIEGPILATGSQDMTIRVWNIVSGECLGVLQGHIALVGQLQLRGKTLVSGGSDSAIRVWNLDKMECVHRIAAHDNSVTCLQFDDERIVSGGPDGHVHVWSLATGKHVRTLGPHFSTVWGLGFRDDRIALAGSQDNSIAIEFISFVPE